MNLYYLRYFVTLAHTQHYTKAAGELCITQPSLSHAIAQLEAELGVQLFEKSGRNTTLTRYGKEFLETAEHALSILDEGTASLQRSANGEGLIRIGMLRTLGVDYIPKLASQFLKENEGKDIRFTFSTGISQELIDGLKRRRFDLVFCSHPAAGEELTAIPVRHQELVIITPEDHPLSEKDGLDLSECAAYPNICFTRDSGLRDVIDSMYKRCDIEPLVAYETEEDEVIAGLVAAGFGLAVVPRMDILQKLEVKIHEIVSPAYERNFYLINDEKIFMPPVVRAFRQFVLSNGLI